MMGRVEYDQLVEYIMTWTCYNSVPQSMVRQWDLLQLWNFWVGILCKDVLGSNGMFE